MNATVFHIVGNIHLDNFATIAPWAEAFAVAP